MDKIEALYNKAVSDYNKYLKEKENSVKKLIAETAKKVLKRELDFTDSINDIIIEALNQEQGRKVIVRCNEKYCNSLRNSVDNWKRETGSNLDVFIIEDITINENSVILVKEEGRAILDIDKAIENIGKIILGES
jgi:flagellar assembly protein FliH